MLSQPIEIWKRDLGDIPSEFFRIFLGQTMTYSCAYFFSKDASIDDAQIAKIDMILDKCNIQDGDVLLDIGCGWGSALERSIQRFNITAFGITTNLYHYEEGLAQLSQTNPSLRDKFDIRLQSWEDFQTTVDRIICIEAIQSIRREQYSKFFQHCKNILRSGGRMVLQAVSAKRPIPWFRVGDTATTIKHIDRAGLRILDMVSLNEHYIKTLEIYAARLSKKRDLKIAPDQAYDQYLRYFNESKEYIENGLNDIFQITLENPSLQN